MAPIVRPIVKLNLHNAVRKASRASFMLQVVSQCRPRINAVEDPSAFDAVPAPAQFAQQVAVWVRFTLNRIENFVTC
jgi:hypothetical protein